MSVFNATSDGLMEGSTVILGKIDGIVLRSCILEAITEEKKRVYLSYLAQLKEISWMLLWTMVLMKVLSNND